MRWRSLEQTWNLYTQMWRPLMRASRTEHVIGLAVTT
jgi:hypothetical protein